MNLRRILGRLALGVVCLLTAAVGCSCDSKAEDKHEGGKGGQTNEKNQEKEDNKGNERVKNLQEQAK